MTQIYRKKIGDIDEKIPDTCGLVTTTALNTKIGEVENKIPNHDKHITTTEFNKLKVSKADFHNKLASFKTKITSNKTKYLEVQKKLNSLIAKYYIFFLRENLFYK